MTNARNVLENISHKARKEAAMIYQKVSADMKFVDREKEVEKFWKDNDIFQKSIDNRKEGPTYTFYDGPPTANGKPHIGHVLTRVIKDMIPRYRTMKGYMVPRKAGWDTHGLPVELEVEKMLGLDGKEQIEEYGIEPFIKHCKESVWKYKGMWEDFSSTVGFWADMDNPYVTYDNNFIESEWWALKQIWDKGLLYKGFKIVPYCPRCGTPLSSHEVAQGYKTLKERTAVVRFKIVGEDAYFLAWTTTPWTLCSNIALCVNPDETYARVKAADGFTYIMAKALLDKVLGGIEREEGTPAYEIIEEYKGKDLEYKEYEPLYQCAKDAADKQHKKAFFVYCDNYVTMEDGTGIVHIAPAFGEDDARVGRKYDAPFVQMVDEAGVMKPETPFAGMRAKPTKKEMEAGAINCDVEVLKELEGRGILFSAPKVEHEYPHCWRCDTPLIYYARESWFIKMTDPEVKANLIANNKTINWIPETIGTGRFGAWLENVQDWGISRNRYWGTPLNIWQCEDCGEMMSIGSIEELKEKSDNCPDNLELHRPYVDAVTCKCPKCQGTMKRVPEVIDCWFDSGSMPFAQHHYPFENKELFEQQFPAKFISEAVDQTRGWFYSLLAISTLLFNKAPYENVIVLGHVQDADGQKMSKSKGNVIDPLDIVNEYGADTLRTYVLFMGDYGDATPWNDSSVKGCKRFIERVAALTDLVSDEPVPAKLESSIHKTIKKVSADIEEMKFNTAIAALMTLINEIYAVGHITKDDLIIFIKLLCPFAPHICEEIYSELGEDGFLSVAEWPEYDEAKTVDASVEIAIQINGKVKSTLEIANGEAKDKVLELAKKDEKIASLIDGKTIVKEIYVPNKIVNIVVK